MKMSNLKAERRFDRSVPSLSSSKYMSEFNYVHSNIDLDKPKSGGADFTTIINF